MEGGRRSKRARLRSTDDDKVDKRMTTRLQERRHREENLRDVLNNHIVCENIASYLSLSDLKAASQVNRQFLQAIRGTRRFAQKAVLAITDKNLQKSTLQKTDYSWRGVRIDVKDSSEILDVLPHVLKSAEFVCLGAPPRKMIYGREAEDPTSLRLLTTVLNSTPALSHLQIGIHFLFTDLRTVLSSPAVQETLKNLNHLGILYSTEYEGYHNAWFLKEEADEEPSPFEFERTFGLLTELPNRLKTFELYKLFPAMEDNADQSILRLLRNNRTIEELSVHRHVWKVQELGTLTFPVLKTLSAVVLQTEEEETLAKFLKNQRSLEELTVKSDALEEFLVTSIRVRCMELSKLDLSSRGSPGDVEEWRFLGSMNRLKEFRFKIIEFQQFMEDLVTNGWKLLAFLPKNQLERLSLEGIFSERRGFWYADGVEKSFRVKTELLEGFRCLRKLSFVGSRDAVDDELMQWLLKEFVSLEELKLSDCGGLTDSGISGRTTAEWGRNASLSDLRGLKKLRIHNCPEVTPNGLASCVQLPFLRSLKYSPPYKVRESVVLALAGQNPRLEKLGVNFKGDLAILQAKVREANPRVELVASGHRWRPL